MSRAGRKSAVKAAQRRLSQLVIAGTVACAALSLIGTSTAAAFSLPPKPVDDPWPDVKPIDPEIVAAAMADDHLRKGFWLLTQNGSNWAGNEAAVNFNFAADRDNPLGQAASCAVDLANSRGEGQMTWALRRCRPAAERGYATAQVIVGLLLEVSGIEYDPRKAAHWFRQAALQNDPIAVAALAECYLAGRGVPADRKIGLDLLRQAQSAEVHIGLALYTNYLRDDQPYHDAPTREAGLKALQVAVQAELWPAQLRLSWLARAGEDGVAMDPQAAHLNGNAALRNLLRAIMTPANMLEPPPIEAPAAGDAWHGVPGEIPAMDRAAVAAALADPELRQALKLAQGMDAAAKAAFRQLAQLGNGGNVIAATAACGLLYFHPALSDVSSAVTWCRRAAERGYGPAELLLGIICRNYSDKDIQARGLQWLELARRQGVMAATPVLASSYARGIGTAPDLKKAQALIGELVHEDTPDGLYARSAQYRRGIGVTIDTARADLYLNQAAAKGNWLAQIDESFWRAAAERGLPSEKQTWPVLRQFGIDGLMEMLNSWQPAGAQSEPGQL